MMGENRDVIIINTSLLLYENRKLYIMVGGIIRNLNGHDKHVLLDTPFHDCSLIKIVVLCFELAKMLNKF